MVDHREITKKARQEIEKQNSGRHDVDSPRRRDILYRCLVQPRAILLQRRGGLETLSWKLACYVRRDELTWSCEENTVYKPRLDLGETDWAATEKAV